MDRLCTFLSLSFMLLSLVSSQEDTTTTTTTSTTTTTTTTTVSTSTNTSNEPTDKPFILCSYAKNHLGTCECPGQVFIADDCRQGFYCIDFNDTSSNYPEDVINGGYDGCKNECEEDEVLIIDPIHGDWNCVPKIANTAVLDNICPGKFNTECGCDEGPDACPIGECECEGQLRVAHDCHDARYCNSADLTQHEDITCPEGEIVFVNMVDHTWECKEDDGRCPGAFHVGCQEDQAPTDRPFTICSYAKNDLGTCECPGQVFIGDECHKGFVCIDFKQGNYPEDVVNGDYDGCVQECREDEVLIVDPRLGDWSCVPKVVNATLLNGVCPGKFNTECPCIGGEETCPIGECECEGQLRVAHDCHDARFCDNADLTQHQDITCPEGEIVFVNMATHDWSCEQDDGRCPGAFHVGCQEDTGPATTTMDPNSGSGTVGVMLWVLVICLCNIINV